MDRVLPTPTKLDLTSHFSAESTTRITLGAFVIPCALHLRAKDVREPPRSDDALWHRNKREVTFHIALCRERRVSSQSARFCSRHQRPPRLLQLHKQQNKNRPHPHGHRKLRQGRVAHRTSSGKRKRQKEHNQCREYPNHQLAFPVHGRSPSTCAVAHIVPQAQHTRQRKSIPRRDQLTPKNGKAPLAYSAQAGTGR